MEWTLIQDRSADDAIWISGIYKVRTYDGRRFNAYYIKDTDKNWGWAVSMPPCREGDSHWWPSLESAQLACEQHATSYTPKPKTVISNESQTCLLRKI